MLFISGMSMQSAYAIENLRKICDKHLPGKSDVQIIDVRLDSQKAVDYQIIAIPTLIKIYPKPQRVILGDLSDTQKVLKILDLV